MTSIKNCLDCGKEMTVENRNTKYCEDCAKIRRKAIADRNNGKRKLERCRKYDDNFVKCTVSNGKSLTIKGFDEISSLKYAAYRWTFKSEWIAIIIKHNKYNDLLEYIKEEYLNFINKNGYIGIAAWAKQHEYITYELIRSIGTETVLNYCGVEYHRNEIDDYKDNFFNVYNQFDRVPLYHEFLENSKIMISNYKKRFNLKVPIYENLIRMYCSEDELTNYKRFNQKYRTELGKATANMNKTLLTLGELEEEFRRVFDFCFENGGTYPSLQLFNSLSKHDDSVYRQKLKMSWKNVCNHYGCQTDCSTNKFEGYVLGQIENILNEKCVHQEKFKWLIGCKGYPLFCDGVFHDHKLVVETDGTHHKKPKWEFGGYERFKIQQANDRLKDKLVQEHGFKMLRIDIDSNWDDVNYLKSRVSEILQEVA